MRLILFRHGPAGHADLERWPDDRSRPLNLHGEERVREASHGLVRLEQSFARVISSPLTRAAQTAELLREELGIEPAVTSDDDLAPGGSLRSLIESLSTDEADGTVILVGHEPDLGKLAGTLIFGAPAHLPLKKAGACGIRFDAGVRAGTGQLAWFLPPKALRRLGRGAGVKT
jgi:phosphohistidine phosphatase